jgi:hypothetical protein
LSYRNPSPSKLIPSHQPPYQVPQLYHSQFEQASDNRSGFPTSDRPSV